MKKGPEPRRFEYQGATVTVAELAVLTGIPEVTLYDRVGRQSLSIDAAVGLGRRTQRQAARQLKRQYDGHMFMGCRCAECNGRRGATNPRTDQERQARARKELAARQAHAARQRETSW